MATLFGLYLLVFLVDELIVFGAAVVTMRAFKLQERHGHALKVVSGVVMLCLATVLLVAPQVLDTIGGAGVVMAGTVVVAIAAVFIDRTVRAGGGPAHA